MPAVAKIVELQPPRPGEREATLYVKGFLGRGEEPDRFEPWRECHESLQDSHGWAAHALGYHWPGGRFPRLPAAVGLAKTTYDVVRVLRNVRRALSAAQIGYLIGEKVVLGTVAFVHQYWQATRSLEPVAEEHASHLRALAQAGTRVRVVAHSLGCRQVIEAASRLSPHERPHEIHLCAPAVREEDVADKLPDLARDGTWLYFTGKDRVLDLGFTPLARGRALGLVGPRADYAGLRAVDVSEHFEFWVHGEYKHRFSRLVPGATPCDPTTRSA